MAGTLYIIGTPIGNLGDITIRALETLKKLDVLYCEDTRRTIKILNHFEIKKPLKSCPGFREKKEAEGILNQVKEGLQIGFASDAGMPGLSDPGAFLVKMAREMGLPVEIIGGPSALSHFIAGSGLQDVGFHFVGFLPARTIERRRFFSDLKLFPTIFFESPHRLESTLDVIMECRPTSSLIFGKEFTKISEQWFFGTAEEIKKQIRSTKGEWVGLIQN